MAGSPPPATSVDDLLCRQPELAARLTEKGMDREALGRLTYTQWEAWLAIGFNEVGKRKNLVIVRPSDGLALSPTFAPTDASRAAQAEHLSRLMAIDLHPGPPFTGDADLAAYVFATPVLDALVRAAGAPPKTKPRNLPFASLGGLFAGRDEDLAGLHNALLGAKGAPGRPLRSRRDRQDAARDRICVVSRGGLFGASVRQRERWRRAQRGSSRADGFRDFSTCQRKRRATTRPRSPPSCAGSSAIRRG